MMPLSEFLDLRAKEHGWRDFDDLLATRVKIVDDDNEDVEDEFLDEGAYDPREVIEKLIWEWVQYQKDHGPTYFTRLYSR